MCSRIDMHTYVAQHPSPSLITEVNLMPPAPLYLRTLRHYTNPILLLLLLLKP